MIKFYSMVLVHENLYNPENKSQLNQSLLNVWGSKEAYNRLKDRNVILIVEGVAHKLATVDDDVMDNVLGTLTSNQKETDTYVVIYVDYTARPGFSSVVIRSSDFLHYVAFCTTVFNN